MLQVEIVFDGAPPCDAYGVVESVLVDSATRLAELQGRDANLTLLLAGDDVISRLHLEFFGDSSTTDVMSFPADELDTSGDYLGDIAISLAVAEAQAREHNHSTTREIAFLALHGLLHLLGFDDQAPTDRDAMLRRQTELLEAFERHHGAL